MSKIGALPPQDVNGFDGLDELHNVEYHMHRGAKSKRRVKKKQTARIKEQGSGPDILSVIQELLFGKRSLYVGIPFVVSGVLVSMLLQLNPLMQRYNPVVICSLAGAVEFRYFPEKSVRAQITIALLVLLSCAVDIFQMGGGNLINPIIAAVVFQILFKLLLLNAFLRNSQGASRTRKYLNRRFRLFMIPLNQPRRIMRDVRGRIIAIGLMQLAAFISYSLLFILFLVYLDFSSIFLGSEWSSSIPSFLVLKLVTTTVVLSSIWYDSDWRLTLWHFGCLGCCINYIRTYITRKRIELKGFPLIYAYSKYRFQVVQFLKFLDVACGMYGWFILSYSFGTRFYSIGSRMQIFCSFMAFSLIVYDLWVVVLVFGVRWLTKRHRIVQDILRESGVGIDSDDSEIEEFGLRMSIEARIERDQDKAALSEARRRLYFARMREEETRWAEKTFDRDARGRRGLTGAVDWVQQSFTWKPKSSNVVHPDIPLHDYNNNNGNNGNGRYSDTGEFLSNEDTMEQELTHTHPLMKQLQNHAEFNNGTRTFDRYDVLWKELKSKDDLRIQAVQRGQEEEEAAKDTITKALQQNPPLKEKTPSYASTIIPPGALTVPTLWSFGKSRIHPGEKPTFLPGGSLGSSGNVRNAELNHKKSTKTASVRFFNSDRGSIMQEDNMEKEWDGDGGKVEIDEMDSDDDHDDDREGNVRITLSPTSKPQNIERKRGTMSEAVQIKKDSNIGKRSKISKIVPLPSASSQQSQVSSPKKMNIKNNPHRGGTQAPTLDNTFSMTTEEFAGIWELLSESSINNFSSVSISENILAENLSSQDTDPTIEDAKLLYQNQKLLSAVIKYLRAQGFGISSAGLYEQRAIDIFCYAKKKTYLSSAVSSGSSLVCTLGLLRVQLYPAVVLDTNKPTQQQQKLRSSSVYLMECTCRCKDKAMCTAFLDMLRIHELLQFIE